MKNLLIKLLLGVFLGLAVSITAHAGDPCPIGIDFIEARPSWRDHVADIKALKTKRLWLGLVSSDKNNGVTLRAHANSPAESAGVRAGDLLVSVNDTPVQTISQSNQAIDHALNANAAVKLVIKREQKNISLTVTAEYVDPVFWGLVNAGQEMECRQATKKEISAEQQNIIARVLVDKQYGFDCGNAHQNKALVKAFESGSLIMMRGGKRLIFVMPGWQTTCVNADTYDDKGFTVRSEKWAQLLNKISLRYVKDRFANP